jgi:hypothetical protein
MSDEVELLRRVYALFNGRDIESVLAAMHPDVVWANHPLPSGSAQGPDVWYFIAVWASACPNAFMGAAKFAVRSSASVANVCL